MSSFSSLASRVGRLGLGCVTFGREIDRAASYAVLDHAHQNGIVHFDTASAYANGESERILGSWIKDRALSAGTLVLSTKIRPPYRRETIENEIGESLTRLGLETVDLLYLHQWSDDLLDPAVLEVLETALTTGRVAAIGGSNFDAAQLGRVCEIQRANGFSRLQAVQNNHNFAVSHVDASLRALCRQEGICIFGYSPLGAGFLTGKHRQGVEAGSRFEVIPGHRNVYFTPHAWERLDRMESVAKAAGQSLPTVALAWALQRPSVDCTLIGGRSPKHIDQALVALALGTPSWLEDLGP